MATTEVEPMVGQATDKECAKSEADIKENLMFQVYTSHFVSLMTQAPFPNDVGILKPKVGLGPN